MISQFIIYLMEMLKKKKHRNPEKNKPINTNSKPKVIKFDDASDNEEKKITKYDNYTLSIVVPSSVVDNAQVNNI
jgi:hypothetical protein